MAFKRLDPEDFIVSVDTISYYVVVLLIVTGIVILAPLSNPTTVKVVVKEVWLPNNVFTVVALKLICEPITVLDTFVPKVDCVFWIVDASVLIPKPLYSDNKRTSAIVAE